MVRTLRDTADWLALFDFDDPAALPSSVDLLPEVSGLDGPFRPCHHEHWSLSSSTRHHDPGDRWMGVAFRAPTLPSAAHLVTRIWATPRTSDSVPSFCRNLAGHEHKRT